MSKLEVSINKGLASAGWHIASAVVTELAEHIESGYVVIPKADLPKVVESSTYATVGTYCMAGVDYETSVARRSMLAAVAWHAHMVERDSMAAARDKRRDELAAEIAGEAEGDPDCKVNYQGMLPTSRIAIDRIIELEATK